MPGSERPACRFEPLEGRTLFAFGTSEGPAALPAAGAVSAGHFHLTARPYAPTGTTTADYLDEVESVVRGIARYQAPSGRIIDPDAAREVQYSTPYFAFAVATLVSAGRAGDLLAAGTLAMDAAARTLAGGRDAQPDDHGEFYLAPLAKALDLYAPHVTPERLADWRADLAVDRDLVLRGLDHNWRTYGMKGEWARARAGLVDPGDARAWIEQSWAQTQRWRFLEDDLGLYRDDKPDPESYAYDAAARGNLLAMLLDGYDGPSRAEMSAFVTRGTTNSLRLQDPTGQAPAGGRSGAHVWNDVVNGLNFEQMAGAALADGDAASAGRFRRAAALAFRSIQRFQQADGTFAVTKNAFGSAGRVGYADYSFVTNYNGYVMYHLAETYLARARAEEVAEAPAPAEVGGYSVATGTAFAAAFANAGGMAVQAALRGQARVDYDSYWTTLGVTRFSRAGWDSRLGPGDGARDELSGLGVSFAPTFLEGGQWRRLASMPDRYAGTATLEFASPLLVRFRIEYAPVGGATGPTFRNEFVVTPDGVLSTVTSSAAPGTFGVTWPLLVDDGAGTMSSDVTARGASTGFAGAGDRQNFLALDAAATVTQADAPVRSAYGDLLPVRAVTPGATNRTFVYPSSAGDPAADAVRESYVETTDGFRTALGRVAGDVYVGRTVAGGFAESVDLDFDGAADLTFAAPAAFALTMRPDGSVEQIETDRAVAATLAAGRFSLQAFSPIAVPATSAPGPGPAPTPTPTPTPTPAIPLSATIVAALPAAAVAGARAGERVAVVIRNEGDAAVTGTATVVLYASGDERVDGSDVEVTRYTGRVNLAADSTRRVRVKMATFPSVPTGTYRLIANVAMPGTSGAVAIAGAATTISAPFFDLSAQFERPVPATMTPGRTSAVRLAVLNGGNARLATTVEVLLEARSAGGDAVVLARVPVKLNLDPNAARVSRLKFVVPPSLATGTYSFTATLDPLGTRVAESDEGNNQAGGAAFVVV